jgi:hypothetical protein
VHDSGAVPDPEIIDISSFGDDPSPIVIEGKQHIYKFNRPPPDEVLVFLGVWRISTQIDLLIFMNVPIVASEGDVVDGRGVIAAKDDFYHAVLSLKILDYGLFVSQPEN